MLPRLVLRSFDDLLKPNKVLVIYGPRQVGKTTLVREYLEHTPFKYRLHTGEDLRVQSVLSSRDLKSLRDFSEGLELLVIDEAQRVPEVGVGLKLLVDHVEGLRIVATGSASFDLSAKVGEPLTGRKATRILYPLAQAELVEEQSQFELRSSLEEFLVYGAYPEVLTSASKDDKKEYLHEIVGSYLLKDVLELERIKNPRHLLDLLKLLAFQIGNDVSLSELASNLGIDSKTVARYLDLLEKSFVIITLSGFSRNLRKEISKSCRYFFIDNGIRNAVISNFNSLDLRDDIGALWENFVLIERMKKNHYAREFRNFYFWRTYDRKEIDLVEEGDGKLAGYEFKYRRRASRRPEEFLRTYAGSSFEVIHRENYFDFIT